MTKDWTQTESAIRVVQYPVVQCYAVQCPVVQYHVVQYLVVRPLPHIYDDEMRDDTLLGVHVG